MPTEAEKRAAALAVSRFGADRLRVQSVFQAVVQAQAQGQHADLLDLLVMQKLLTSDQARELRLALDATQVDPSAPPRRWPNDRQPGSEATVDTDEVPALDPLQDIRTLGDYRILRRLGVGGMGSVYLAYHEGQAGQVAIKVLADNLANNQAYVDRFYREARSGALLNHPNIVRGLAVGQDRATQKHYLVMEFVDGPSAHALLHRFGRLAVADAVHVVLDIARALEHAHSRNIVHRDIKPDNILITQTGVAKLADLGLAKRTDEASHLTAARQGFGTPYYMPYEQAVNARHADGRSDIYALGATLYHLVTGEVPFKGENHLEVVDRKDLGEYLPASVPNPGVPPALDAILERMLARYPHDRYQTASELIVDLERSRLAAPVPSFVDADLALQDPTVRARLTAPTQPTRPDLAQSHVNGAPGLWYLRFRDQDGRWCKAKATTRQIVSRLRDGRIPPEAEACHRLQDGFRPLASYPELRLIEPKATKSPARAERRRQGAAARRVKKSVGEEALLTVHVRSSRRWLIWFGVGGAALVAIGLLLYKMLSGGI